MIKLMKVAFGISMRKTWCSYKEGDDLYLMENETKHGPYQQVSYRVPKNR